MKFSVCYSRRGWFDGTPKGRKSLHGLSDASAAPGTLENAARRPARPHNDLLRGVSHYAARRRAESAARAARNNTTHSRALRARECVLSFRAARAKGFGAAQRGVMIYTRKRIITWPGGSPCGVFQRSGRRAGVGEPM